MKKCPTCGMQYQDSENFCIADGVALVKMQLAEMPPSELMNILTHIKDMEKEIVDLKENAVRNDEISKMSANAKDILALKGEIESIRKLSSALPADDIVTLVTHVSELENMIGDVDRRISSIKNIHLPEDLIDIAKHGKGLVKLRDEIKGLRATIRKDVANVAVSVLKGVRRDIYDDVQKFKNVIMGVEDRTTGEIKGIREELAALEETVKFTSGKSIEKGLVASIRNDIATLKKAQEKSELDRVMPDETVERKLGELLDSRMGDLKINVTREMVTEIRKMIGR